MINFKNTQEAILFGRNATEEEKNQLKTRRSELLEQYEVLEADGDFNEAMKIATQAQLCREALSANTAPELIAYGKTL